MASLRPPPGAYPITLGASFAKQKQIHLMRYDFKPASLSHAAVGDMELRSDRSAALVLPSSSAGADIELVGVAKDMSGDDGLVCLLVFDPASGRFELERIETSLHHLKENPVAASGAPRARKQTTPAVKRTRAAAQSKRPAAAATKDNDAAAKKPRTLNPTAAVAVPVPPAASAPHPEFADDDGVDVNVTGGAFSADATAAVAFSAHSAAAAAASLGAPTRAAAQAMDFAFEFPTVDSVREGAATATSSEPPADGQACARCKLAIAAADLPSPAAAAASATTRALQCGLCFSSFHAHCSTGGAQDADSDSWYCADCNS